MVWPNNSTDMATTWKIYHFILSVIFNFHIVNSLSIAVLVFPKRILSVDEILLPRFVKWFTNFRGWSYNVEKSVSCFKHMNRIHIEANASCCLFHAMQQTFSLGRCICKNYLIIWIIYLYDSYCWISSASCLF